MKYTDVYVKGALSLEQVTEIVGRVTGAEMQRFDDEDPEALPMFAGLDDERRFSVQENPWRGDEESVLGAYTIDIDVDGPDDESRIGAAKEIFEALKEAGCGDLVLVDELQGELDRFSVAHLTRSSRSAP